MARTRRTRSTFAVALASLALAACETTPAPRAAPAAAAVPPAPPVHLERISADGLFPFSQATINASGEGRAALDAVVAKLARDSRGIAGMQVIGHSDRVGNEEANVALSTRRAQAVRDYLARRGIPAGVIHAVGVGSAEPLVQCPGEQGQALIRCLTPNRRVEILINYED